jgi:hypothetical protein
MRLNGWQRHSPSAGSMNSGYAMGGFTAPAHKGSRVRLACWEKAQCLP